MPDQAHEAPETDRVPPDLVTEKTPHGPRFTTNSPKGLRAPRYNLAYVLGRRDRVTVALLTAGWLISLIIFWEWWLQPAHRVSMISLGVNSALLAYVTLMPAYFLIAVNRLRKFSPEPDVPRTRTAFVVTKAPSEPDSVVRRTLQAMLAQDYPQHYDVWLCDEDPSTDTLAWCHDNGIRVSTRKYAEDYHRDAWPRRSRCKEGNLSYFYDHWGYHEYDVVAQLDCDHEPGPTYLSEIVRPFSEPSIGYVAAPSVCDANASDSWAGRGRLHREAVFHGAMQLGHEHDLAPVCIGSHYAVRTRALRQIGGIGPELAEDFSTTFLMSSAGWRGAFAIIASASGNGPFSFTGMLTQEFQWSRSLTTLMLTLVPRHLARLPWLLRCRFLVVLMYYPLLAVTTLGGISLPAIAAVAGMAWINVNYFSFLLHWWMVSCWLLATVLFLKRKDLLRPRSAPVLSWELWLFSLARWPYVALGVGAAVVQLFKSRPVRFAVTSKTPGTFDPLPIRVMLPYLTITVGLSVSAIIAELSTDSVGYTFLCLLGATSYTVVSIAVPVLHAHEISKNSEIAMAEVISRTVRTPLRSGLATLFPLSLAIALYPPYAALLFG